MSFQAISGGFHGELVYDGEVELRLDRQGKGEPWQSVVNLLFAKVLTIMPQYRHFCATEDEELYF